MALREPRLSIRIAVPVLAPLVFLALLEGGLRAFGVGAPDASVLREEVDDAGQRLFAIRAPHSAFMGRRQFNPQSVPERKVAGEVRILALGGSLPYGWPFDDPLSFPRLLEVGLRAVAPETAWRVVNLGAPGWGTARLRAMLPEVVRLDADLALIVSGNNEYLDAVSPPSGGPPTDGEESLWERLYRSSRLVAVLAPRLRRLAISLRREGDGLLSHSVSPEGRALLVERHAANLAAAVVTLREAGARVYLATVPVNLRSCPPFGRDAPGEALSDAGPELAAVYRRAAARVDAGRPEEALPGLSDLARQAPGSARVQYLWARALEAAGRNEAARSAYERALDLDRLPLRAFGALNANAAIVAGDTGARLVDLVDAVERASAAAAPGDDLFLDNAHPNRRGAAVLALAFARAMAADGVLAAGAGWEGRFRRAVRAYLEALEVPNETRVAALEFLLLYYTEFNPDAGRARGIQGRLRALRPE